MPSALTRYKGPPIPHARNKRLLTKLLELREQGLLQVDPATGVWTATPGRAEMERLKTGKTHELGRMNDRAGGGGNGTMGSGRAMNNIEIRRPLVCAGAGR